VETEDKVRTGAIKLENGNPWLRAKAQTCRDAAARQAIFAAVKLTIIIAVIISVAARL